MKAIIMAGGEGKRLRPITCTMPKPMVPVLNRPIVEYTMELLKKHGITDAVYTLHYMGETIRNYVGDGSRWGLKCSFAESDKPLGTAGSVRQAVEDAPERIIVLSGDGITDIDLTELIDEHEKSGAPVTIALKMVKNPGEYGIAVLDKKGDIERFIEKPDKSEVFSDLANTGIYIIEPEVVEMIPKDKEFDFSKDLFPMVMEKKMRIHGCRVNGYWCDVGDIAELRRAQADMLNGKCKFYTSAMNYAGIFVEANAQISDSATLIPPCYIGSGVQIADKVIIEPYSVIGSNAIIESGTTVKRSIIFENAVIRSNAELRGTVVCENAHVDSRASLYEGSTIGAGTHIGTGVTVRPGVGIWPDKEIEGGFNCEDNFVWGNSVRRVEFEDSSIRGYADIQLTPEAALRLGAAFASRFTLPARAAVCCDGSQVSVVLKHSVISGIASQGVDVVAVNTMSRSAFGFTIAQSGCEGGIYVEGGSGRETALIVFDKTGIEAPKELMRSIKASFIFGEQKPSTAAELGVISQSNGMEDVYETRLTQQVDAELLRNARKILRLDTDEQTFRIVSRVVLRLGWKVERAYGQRIAPVLYEDEIAITKFKNGMLAASVDGMVADERKIMAVIAANAIDNGEMSKFALPVSFAEEYREELKRRGAELIFSAEQEGKIKRAAMNNNAYYPPLYEEEAMILKLCEIFAKGKLAGYIEQMPVLYSVERSIQAGGRDVGRILRRFVDGENQADKELIDGVKLKFDTGWVIVKPGRGKTSSFRIVAGSSSEEYARELCDIYTEKLKNINDSNE